MNFISREAVLAILRRAISVATAREAIEALPFFPAPNPTESGGGNVLGQTDEEFWEGVERADIAGDLPR